MSSLKKLEQQDLKVFDMFSNQWALVTAGTIESFNKTVGLTPVAIGNSVTYEEANLTFLCKKLYQHQFEKEDLAQEICDYYKAGPRKVYPLDEKGDWQTHIMFIGQIIDEADRR